MESPGLATFTQAGVDPPDAALSPWSLARIAWVVTVAALSTLALFLRSRGLDPVSLWLDDQWVAIVVRKMSLGEFFSLKPTVPLGFVLLEKLAARLSADPEWPLQVVPLACSVAQVPLAAVLVRRLTDRRSLGLLAAALVVVDPLQVDYAIRVKPFAADTLVTLGILVVGAPLLERWSTRRAIGIAAGALAAVAVSLPSVLVSFPLLNLALLRAAWRRQEGEARMPFALATLLAFDLALVVLLVALLHGQAGAAMRDYWSAYFLPLEPTGAVRFLGQHGYGALRGFLPPALAPCLALVPVGLVGLARDPGRRGLAAFCALFYLELTVVSALHLYPLGGGRTDTFAHPVALVLLLAGLRTLTTVPRLDRIALLVLPFVAGLVVLLFGRPSVYPRCGDAVVVHRAEALADPGDSLLVYPHGAFAVGYYGGWPVELVPWPDFAHGFQVVIRREDSLTLPPRGAYWETPSNLEPELDDFLARPHRRILYVVCGWPQPVPHEAIMTRLVARGYRATAVYREGMSMLVVLEPTTGRQG